MTDKPFDLSSAKPHYHNLSDKNPFAYAFGQAKAATTYKYDMHYGCTPGKYRQKNNAAHSL